MAGIAGIWWFLWVAQVDAKIWNSLPYAACAAIAAASRGAFPAAIAAASMLVLDSFLAISVILETRSPWLMPLSVVSTLKVILVLPLGLALGWFLQHRYIHRTADEARKRSSGAL